LNGQKEPHQQVAEALFVIQELFHCFVRVTEYVSLDGTQQNMVVVSNDPPLGHLATNCVVNMFVELRMDQHFVPDVHPNTRDESVSGGGCKVELVCRDHLSGGLLLILSFLFIILVSSLPSPFGTWDLYGFG